MALNTLWESRPRRGSRNKDRKLWAELIRIIQRTNGGTDDVVSIRIKHIVNRRVDEQAATATTTKSTIDSCAIVGNYLVALRYTLAEFECASRPANYEYFVSARESLTVSTITEVLTGRRGRKLVDNFPTPAPARN
jgi:hypothetical protein